MLVPLATAKGSGMHVLVCGADSAGAVLALLLAAEGHRVTVLDPRPALPASGDPYSPGPVGTGSGAPHPAGLPLLRLLPGTLLMLAGELPGLVRELTADGSVDTDGTQCVVPRALITRALTKELDRTDGVSLERGVDVVSLLTGTERLPGRPHVQGVLTDSGEAVLADLVVDAVGRDSEMVRLLSEVGAPRALEERQDHGVRLYTRHFGSSGTPPGRARWSLRHFDGVTVASVSAGRGMWSMTLGIDDEDRRLYPLAEPSAWNRAARLYEPLLPASIGSPLPGVRVTPRVESCYRRFVLRGRPVATGTVSIGGSWAAINPLLGLGPSMGLLHALLLRNVLGQGCAEEAVVAFDRLTENLLSPLHHRITGWEEQLQAGADAPPAGRLPLTDAGDVGHDETSAEPDTTPEGLARELLARFAALTADAAISIRTGPSRTALVGTLTRTTSTTSTSTSTSQE